MRPSPIALLVRPLLLGVVCAVSFAVGAEPLPGGVRPLQTELDGRWIGNGVAFSPYRRGQAPGERLPTAPDVLEDLRLVSRHWNLIRLYDSSPVAETTLALIREHRLPVRVMLGAWIKPPRSAADEADNRAQVAAAIRLANTYRDIVLAVNVGNETQVEWSGHRSDATMLIGHLRAVRAAIRQPVTTADDLLFWRRDDSRRVAAEVDFITLHLYALWNGRPLDGAIAWMTEGYELVARLHAGKTVIVGETGWATQRDPAKNSPREENFLMKAETSLAAQESYLRQHNRWVNSRKIVTFLFEAFDEPWKGSGPDGSALEAEKHWGVFDEHRRPKASFEAAMRDLSSPPSR